MYIGRMYIGRKMLLLHTQLAMCVSTTQLFLEVSGRHWKALFRSVWKALFRSVWKTLLFSYVLLTETYVYEKKSTFLLLICVSTTQLFLEVSGRHFSCFWQRMYMKTKTLFFWYVSQFSFPMCFWQSSFHIENVYEKKSTFLLLICVSTTLLLS